MGHEHEQVFLRISGDSRFFAPEVRTPIGATPEEVARCFALLADEVAEHMKIDRGYFGEAVSAAVLS